MVHLMGSHPEWRGPYRGKYATFVRLRRGNCYLYTAWPANRRLLNQRLCSAFNARRQFFVSTADHGLAFKRARQRRAQLRRVTTGSSKTSGAVYEFALSATIKRIRIVKLARSQEQEFSLSFSRNGQGGAEIKIAIDFGRRRASPNKITKIGLHDVLGGDIFH